MPKRNYNENSIEPFKQQLREIGQVELKKCEDTNEVYKHFFETFISIYDGFFPKVKVRIKIKSHSPWITERIAKSPKRKQKLYGKYQKRRANETETVYKLHKNLFQSIEWKSKHNYHSEKLLEFTFDSKKYEQ